MCDPQKLGQLKDNKAKYDEKVAKVLQKMPERKAEFVNTSGIPINRVYTPLDQEGFDYLGSWACPGATLLPGRCRPRPIEAASGPCASMPGSAAPRRPTNAIISS